MKDLEKFKDKEVGQLKKEKYKGKDVIVEVVKIVEHDNGFVSIHEIVTEDKGVI